MVSSGRGRSFEGVQVDEVRDSDIVRFLKGSSGFVTFHVPEFNEFGEVVDAALAWWNDAYENIRTEAPYVGETYLSTTTRGQGSLAAMTEAWRTGHCVRHFEFRPDHLAFFKVSMMGKQTWMEWQRTGDLLVRTVFDLDEMDAIDDFYTKQDSIVAHAVRMRAVAVERERIARNLHDTVIQNLYATALSLSLAGEQVHGPGENAFNTAIESIGQVIAQIRREILDCETRQSSPLRSQIEAVVLPLITLTNTNCEVEVSVRDVPEGTFAHVRSVCTEAVSNAVRHGGATSVSILLDMPDDRLRLVVADNGTGFATGCEPHNGLKNMRARAETLGGTMEIHNGISGGAEVVWSVPTGGAVT